MPQVIFVRPRTEYQSYVDLYRLCELSGCPLIYPDEVLPDSDNVYIHLMLNGEWLNGWPDSRARHIFWDLEWHLEGIPNIPGVHEIWAADEWYAARQGWKYVPLASDARLAPADLPPYSKRTFEYDVTLLAYLTYRRLQVRGELLVNEGLRLGPNGLGAEREHTLAHTRLMLHVHQLDNAPTVAPQRFALAAAYGLPLLSENVAERGLFGEATAVFWSDFAYIPSFTRQLLRDGRLLADFGHGLHRFLCHDHTFLGEVFKAL